MSWTAARQGDGCRGSNSSRLEAPERGAAVVETAIVAPFLLLIILGIVEFGLLFGVKLDVNQGAREMSRLAAVNHQETSGSSGSTQTTEIVTAACQRMELADSSTVSIALPAGTAIGDIVEVEIKTPYVPVTGVLDPWLAGTVLSSKLSTRLEQNATFAATTDEACP